MANIILQGLTTDQLSEIIRESVRDEMQGIHAPKPNQENQFLTRREVLAMLGIDSSTLWRWAKTGYLVPVGYGGRKRYRAADVRAITEGKR
jgi:predicted DNA-binding transcriptional regulator AlpA